MNIHKGKQKMKDNTINDILYEGQTGKQFAFTQEGNTSTSEAMTAALFNTGEKMAANMVSEIQQRQHYNNTIKDLDPMYTSLIPLGSVIVRIELIEDEIKKDTGLIIPKLVTVKADRQSGQGTDAAPDPFRFRKTAIIVALPRQSVDLKVGMRVQLVNMQMLTDKGQVVGYSYEYAHPEYDEPMISRIPTNPHFGYAIVPFSNIKVIISEN